MGFIGSFVVPAIVVGLVIALYLVDARRVP
jgi:hypothetical protein